MTVGGRNDLTSPDITLKLPHHAKMAVNMTIWQSTKSTNPYVDKGKYSPVSLKEQIKEQQRVINSLETAIKQAQGYLNSHPNCQPVAYRLDTMRKDKVKACSELSRLERALAVLLEKLGKG